MGMLRGFLVAIAVIACSLSVGMAPVSAASPKPPASVVSDCKSAAARAGSGCVTKATKVGAKCPAKQLGFLAVTFFKDNGAHKGFWRLAECRQGDLGRLWYLVP